MPSQKDLPKPDPPKWYSVKEAAQYLGVTVNWIERRVSERRITYHKIGGWQIKFRQEDLDEQIETIEAGRPRDAA